LAGTVVFQPARRVDVEPGDSTGPSHGLPKQRSFTAKTVDGKEFSGESLTGKPAVLWFWADELPWRWSPANAAVAGQAPSWPSTNASATRSRHHYWLPRRPLPRRR
jgi:hypothetical protein